MSSYIPNIIKFVVKMGIMGSLRRLRKECYTKVGALEASYAWSAEPVPFEDKDSLTYKPIRVGQVWSNESYGCAWFRLKGKVPATAKGEKVALLISDGGEGCIYDEAGVPVKGITDIGAFIDFAQPHIGKRYYEVAERAEGGEEIDIFMDAGNNKLPTLPCKQAKLKQADIVVVHDDVKALYYDVLALLFQQSVAGKGDGKVSSIAASVKAALRKYFAGDLEGARAILKKEADTGVDSPYTFYATGHAHLDLAWLWPIRETKRKAARTFANQVWNMDKYPDYVFGASQPQQFEWMEERHPELFEKIKEKVASGQLELQGGMWVECDTNVTSGESLIRQNLYGKKYWKEKFGQDMRMCWLPDVFGFSGNLPQILKKCGMDYFETIKLSWNEHNKFPHRAFIWEGIDDSSVIVHMPPDETYNSEGSAWSYVNAIKNFPERDKIKNIGLLYGVGDGGGGPSEGHIEMVRRAGSMKGLPKVKMAKAIDLFDKLKEQEDVMVRHKGELYLEKHQGTYTTQGKNKLNNRKIEFSLHNTEFILAVAEAKGYPYPKEKLDKIWKEMLLYQFHDIIPGSSIARVYTESVARYEKMLEELQEMRRGALEFLSAGKKRLTVVNGNSYRFKGLVPYKDKWYSVDVAPYSSAPLTPYAPEGKSVLSVNGNTIESDIFAVTFDPYGNIKSLIDKRDGKEYCGSFMNKLNVYRDKRLHYNAWDIDIKYTKKAPAEFKLIDSHTTITDGAVVRENMYKYGSSSISQKVVLVAGRPIVDFVTTVDWQETHKMLRADFRPAVFSKQVTCDIQLGNLKRSTSDDTKVEKAQFEICAHKWIDLSDGGRGISVAPDADKGMHTICYALCPHGGDHNDADIQRNGYLYNNRPFITEYEVDIPSYFVSSDTHIVVETVKRAENGNGVVVRVYEDSGIARTATITTPLDGKVYETDLLENVIGEAELNDLAFKPFEIRTFFIEDRS